MLFDLKHWADLFISRSVTSITFNYAVEIAFMEYNRPPLSLGLDCAFLYKNGNISCTIEPTNPSDITPILYLVSIQVAQAEISPEGTFKLVFSNGVEIEAYPDPGFESWAIYDSAAGEVLAALPGGTLDGWSMKS